MTDATRLTWLADEVERLQQRLDAWHDTGLDSFTCTEGGAAEGYDKVRAVLADTEAAAKAHDARVAAEALSAAAHGLLATLPPVGDKARAGVLLAIEALEAQAKEER